MELGLTPDTRRPVELDTAITAAQAAGFAKVGLTADRCNAPANAALRIAGLGCHEVLGLQVGPDLDAADAMAIRLAAAAGVVGAQWVLVTFQVALTTVVAAAVRRWATAFEEAGAGLAVEFTPLGPVATIADALGVLLAASPARAGIVIDSWNYCIRPPAWVDLEEVPLAAIAYIQFSDACERHGEPDIEDAMRRRALPGEGVLDLERFSATLRGRGWDGIVSMQVLSDELRQLPIDEYARQVFAAGVRYWL
jgi:sugar phosphate isomerase/epimerase